MVGIYKITNKLNNRSYIGCSKNVEKRWVEHKYKAYAKTPSNKEYEKALYRAIRKYGVNSFDFEVLEECKKDEMYEKEIGYISKYNTFKNGYNETPGGEGVKDNSGERHSKTSLTNEEVFYIRECYNNHLEQKEVYKQFKDRIGLSGFKKIWNGYSWQKIHMDVYTEENKQYYIFKRNSNGGKRSNAKLTPEEVRDIRIRKKNGDNMKDVYNSYSKLTYGSFKNLWSGYSWEDITVD